MGFYRYYKSVTNEISWSFCHLVLSSFTKAVVLVFQFGGFDQSFKHVIDQGFTKIFYKYWTWLFLITAI